MSPKSKIRYVDLSYSKHTKIFLGHVTDHKCGQNTQSLGCWNMQERVRDFGQNFDYDDDFVSKQIWKKVRRRKLQLKTGKFNERVVKFHEDGRTNQTSQPTILCSCCPPRRRSGDSVRNAKCWSRRTPIQSNRNLSPN